MNIEEIKALSIFREEKAVFMRYDLAVVEKKKDDVYTLSKEIMEFEEEKKELMSAMNEKVKALKDRHKVVVNEVTHGGCFERQACYAVPNYDNGVMEFYSTEGKKVDQRRLTPQEKAVSTNVLNLSTGTKGE